MAWQINFLIAAGVVTQQFCKTICLCINLTVVYNPSIVTQCDCHVTAKKAHSSILKNGILKEAAVYKFFRKILNRNVYLQ